MLAPPRKARQKASHRIDQNQRELPLTTYAEVNQTIEPEPPLLRVTTSPSSRNFFRLATGKQGSLQTAAVMAALVRDAAVKDKQLELWATQILVNNNLDSHSDPYEIADTLLRYVQRFSYIHDPAGSFDSVQSARQVIREGKGDCDDLSVLLATLLALVGFKPRFVLAKYKESSDGFDHVYVDLELPRGRVALDPSSRKHGIGWESPKYLERIAYPIFDGKVVGLGDIAGRVKKLFSSLGGYGCSSSSCDGSLSCGSGNCKAATVAPKIVAAGSDNSGALGGVTLSLPAVLFGLGIAIGALKLFDSLARDWR